MLNRDARNRRSRSPDAPVQAVTGMTIERMPPSWSTTFSASGVNIVLMLFASMTPAASESLAGNSQWFMTSCTGGVAEQQLSSAAELQPELMPNEFYTFAIERDTTGYTLEASGNFARVGQKTLRFHRPFIVNNVPIWHYNSTASEYDGRFDDNLVQNDAYGSTTWPNQWPTAGRRVRPGTQVSVGTAIPIRKAGDDTRPASRSAGRFTAGPCPLPGGSATSNTTGSDRAGRSPGSVRSARPERPQEPRPPPTWVTLEPRPAFAPHVASSSDTKPLDRGTVRPGHRRLPESLPANVFLCGTGLGDGRFGGMLFPVNVKLPPRLEPASMNALTVAADVGSLLVLELDGGRVYLDDDGNLFALPAYIPRSPSETFPLLALASPVRKMTPCRRGVQTRR